MSCEYHSTNSWSPIWNKSNIGFPNEVPPLKSLYLYIAGSCNLTCRHCWIDPDFENSVGNGKFLDIALLKKAVIEAIPLGLRSVKLTGGEPMLHPFFKEIVECLERERLRITMETNGTLIDDDMAAFIKSKPCLSFISVSLDGAKAATHDDLRGVKGSFDQAVSGINKLVDAGLRPQMICTLHRNNRDEIHEIIALAKSLGCGSVKFGHIQKIGRGGSLNNNFILDIPEIIRLFESLEKRREINSEIPIHFDIPIAFYPIKKLLSNRLPRCNVLNILSILNGGEVSLCGIGVTIPELVFGNIKNKNLETIWVEEPQLLILRSQIPHELESICGNCLYKDYCLGYCVANNYHCNKKFNSGYGFCEKADKLGQFPKTRKRRIK